MGEPKTSSGGPSLLTVTVAAAGVLVLAAALYFIFASGDDDDRPPIVVNNGSVNIWGGNNQKDSDDIKRHWRNWTQDSSSKKWTPDLPHGKPVDHYAVTLTPDPNKCGTMTGDTVVVQFTPTGTSKAATFTFTLEPAHGNSKKLEPNVYTDSQVTEIDVNPGSSGGPPIFPANLLYDAKGYISMVTVTTASSPPPPPPAASCPIGPNDKPDIEIAVPSTAKTASGKK